MSSILEKMKQLKQANEARRGGGVSSKGIWFKPQKENKIRFVGDFMESHTHNIDENNPIIIADGGMKIYSVACLNWDYENQKEIDGGCPLCKLNELFFNRMRKETDPDRKDELKKLSLSCLVRKGFKWNVFDSVDPYCTKNDDGMETRVRGFKVWRLPLKTYEDIAKLAMEAEIDVTDPDKGVWFKINKEATQYATRYTVSFSMNKGQIELAPMSPEDKALPLHDLKALRDFSMSADEIIMALRPDLREEYDFLGNKSVPAPSVSFKKATAEKKPEPPANPNLTEDTRVPWGDNDDEEKAEEEPVKMDNACFGKIDPSDPQCKACAQRRECMDKTMGDNL